MKQIKKINLFIITLVMSIAIVSCDKKEDLSYMENSEFSKALSDLKISDSEISGTINREAIKKLMNKESGNNLNDRDINEFIFEGLSIQLNSRRIREIEGNNRDEGLEIFATYAEVYGPNGLDQFSYEEGLESDILQSTSKVYTDRTSLSSGNYGAVSYVTKFEVYPNGVYIPGSSQWLCYNSINLASLPGGQISCSSGNDVIIRAKATYGNYINMTQCTADFYCDN